eukprot:11637202-Alexandrium_andersonii.AAC.1
MADCGLRRIAARTGLGLIAECTLGTLRCGGLTFKLLLQRRLPLARARCAPCARTDRSLQR